MIVDMAARHPHPFQTKRCASCRAGHDPQNPMKRGLDDCWNGSGLRPTPFQQSSILTLIVAHQMRREGAAVAKCTVERLMRAMGLAGVRRGKTTITTVSNPKAPCPLDKVNREFRVSRPNALWVVDFTYVHTWAGFVYVAFVIDAYARRIAPVPLRVSIWPARRAMPALPTPRWRARSDCEPTG
jgi:hypothetical protein